MTPNDLECERIMQMSESSLLDYVMKHPEYLTDSYYQVFCNAMYARASELHENRERAINRGKAISNEL